MTTYNPKQSLDLLLTISRELTTTPDLHVVLARVLSITTSYINAERGSLIVLDDNNNPIDAAIVYINRVIPEIAEQLKGTLDHGLAGWVVKNKKAVLLNDTSMDGRWQHREDDNLEQTGPKSAICIPLTAKEHTVGVLTLVHPETGFFTDEHLSLLQSIADQIGSQIYNARLFESLQTAHKRFQDLFNDNINPIFITDMNGNIVEANREAESLSGYSRKKLVNKPITKMHDPRWDLLGKNFNNLMPDNTITYEAVLDDSKQKKIPVEVYVRQVETEGAIFLQWIIKDICERKQLDNLRDDLMAMIYHDLRSPLANIISSLEILSNQLKHEKNKDIKTLFDIANRSTERMQRLINSLLDIHRLESNKPLSTKAVVGVHELINDSVDAIRFYIENKKQTIMTILPDEDEQIQVDPDVIKRVLINLIENASKFTPDDGKITVGASREQDHYHFWVEDTGKGIPEDAQEMIFEKFTRLQMENMPRGLGLGLSFCRLAVKAHGGEIWVESREGTGSKFIFSIPM